MALTLKEAALELHRAAKGKIEVRSKVPVRDAQDLSLAYSPGVAEPCRHIHKDTEKVWEFTGRGNMVAVVSDGTAVLGLGDIGPEAALPVMEGKAVLFKRFAGVDAFPIVLASKDPDEIVQAVKLMAPSFGGVNLEDISAPRCFEIEERLKKEVDIPVFHDDQHGTAVVVYAGLTNALKIVKKKLSDVRVVMCGAGAAGMAIIKLLVAAGVGEILVCDRLGCVYQGRKGGMTWAKEELARITNQRCEKGGLAEVVRGADIFIGVSAANMLTADMVRSMAREPIIFALANPDPEITREEALSAGARIMATGRSDYPNQVNNVLGFPGIFRGALDVRARAINEEMKMAAAQAIAALVSESELGPDYIIPKPFDPRVAPNVAIAVAEAAVRTGVARLPLDPEVVRRRAGQGVEAEVAVTAEAK